MESANDAANSPQTVNSTKAKDSPQAEDSPRAADSPQGQSIPQGKNSAGLAAQLFLTFFKIGLFTFGGGYAMIPLIREEIVRRKHWIADEDLLDITAIAESTPGPIAINSATFVGTKVAGFWGAAAATVGVVIPSFVIIYVISFILKQFENFAAVRYAFAGIRAGVLALILGAMISMYRQCPKSLLSYILMAASLIAVAFFNVSVLLVIAVCAAVGLVNASLTRRRGTKNENSETGEDSENDGNGVDGRDGGNHPDESAARRKGHRK